MNTQADKILFILNHVHEQLSHANELCKESNEKWIRNESISLNKFNEIVQMHILTLQSANDFNEKVKASGCKFEDFDSYINESIKGYNELFKQSAEYGFPERKEGEDENEYLKRLMADVNKTLSDNEQKKQ